MTSIRKDEMDLKPGTDAALMELQKHSGGVWGHECLWTENRSEKTQENIKGKTWLREQTVSQKVCFWITVHCFNRLPPQNHSPHCSYLDWASPQGPRIWNRDENPHLLPNSRETRKSTAQSNAKPFALSTPTSTFFFLWSIWKTVSSAKNKNNPPVRHPEAWQWSQKQITSFRSAWRYEA